MSKPQKTQKSWKNTKRDKPKHSGKGHKGAKKSGAGGKGTWGTFTDDLASLKDSAALDSKDPNYDQTKEKHVGVIWEPKAGSRESGSHLKSYSAASLIKFKAAVKNGIAEYLVSYNVEEFVQMLEELDQHLFHQDIPAILVKVGLDKKGEDRVKLSALLHKLNQQDVVTRSQLLEGFKKLFNSLPELSLDVPNAKVLLHDFVCYAVASRDLDPEEAQRLEKNAALLADKKEMAKHKQKIKELSAEYLSHTDMYEFIDSFKDIPACFHHEIIKRTVSISLDRTDKERELVSQFVESTAGKEIELDEIVKGFSILMTRTEDLKMDVPNVVDLLSKFVARATVDEALPPAFLLRIDLAGSDLGIKVVEKVQLLLAEEKFGEKLLRCWTGESTLHSIMKQICELSLEEKYEVLRNLEKMLR